MKMNTEILFLFLILLLGLLFCSILGGNCGKEGFEPKNTQLTGLDSPRDSVVYEDDIKTTTNTKEFDNYNHFSNSKSDLITGMTFYGPNGGSVVVKTDSDGKQLLEVITTSADIAEMYNQDKNKRKIKFYGPSDSVATIIKTPDGQIAVRVKNHKGTITYTLPGTTPFNPEPLKEYYKLPTEPKGDTEIHTPNTVGGLFGLGVGKTKDYGTTYFDALPKGIPKSQIPPGQEDLYILKSQIVPPVCPACPACPPSKAVNTALGGNGSSGVSVGVGGYTTSTGMGSGQSQCAPCPPCGRCKEPDFECKKVPTYSPSNTYLPVPVLSNFSTFGM